MMVSTTTSTVKILMVSMSTSTVKILMVSTSTNTVNWWRVQVWVRVWVWVQPIFAYIWTFLHHYLIIIGFKLKVSWVFWTKLEKYWQFISKIFKNDGKYDYEYGEKSDGEYEYENGENSDGQYEYEYESVLVLKLVTNLFLDLNA